MLADVEWAVDGRNIALFAGTIITSILAAMRIGGGWLAKKIKDELAPEVQRVDGRIDLLVLAGEHRDRQLTEHMEVETIQMNAVREALVAIRAQMDECIDSQHDHEIRITKLESH